MKCLHIVISTALVCASCSSLRSQAEIDGITRRKAALAILAREKEMEGKPFSDSHARDLVEITKMKMREFGAWRQDETGWQPSFPDRKAILDLITAETDRPLLLIRQYPGGRAHVNTGVIRGPLDGGGTDFYLLKIDSSWCIVYRLSWIS